MKIFAKVGTPFFQIDYTHNPIIPDGDFVEIEDARPTGNWHAKSDGKWHPGDPDKEALFINIEMQVIAEQLLMHEDNDDSAIATENDWREYRKQLRKWNWDQNQYFPNPQYRPKRPE